MGLWLFLLFAALAFSAVSFSLKDRQLQRPFSALQIISVAGGLLFFSYLFISRSTETNSGEGLSLQIINELPQTIDFYLIKNEKIKKKETASISHIGTIRTDYYRLEHLQLQPSDSFQILGMLGKNAVYLSGYQTPNPNVDQIITVKNYSVESEKRADDSMKLLTGYNAGVRDSAIWMCMDLLLLFLNAMLLFRKYRHLFLNV